MDERDIQYHLHFRQQDYHREAEQERLINRVIKAVKHRRRKPQQERQAI